MTDTLSPSVQVDWEQIAAFRLSRHHLFQPAPRSALLTVAADMNGAQAQLLSAAQLSLRTRVQNLSILDIENAITDRSLVKAACMRRTLFLVPAELLAVYVRGSSRRAEKEVNWARGKGINNRDLDAAIDATLQALDQPLTRNEIANLVSQQLGVEVKKISGGGWGSTAQLASVPVGHLHYPVVDLLHLTASRGVVCYGPNRGNEPTFVRADAWIPDWKDYPVEEAEDQLLRRYLHSFGPATADDFALWCGITLREARTIWSRSSTQFQPIDVDGWKAFVHQDDVNDLVNTRIQGFQVKLLPYFDTFLLGHKTRDHLATAEHRPHIYRPQGWIASVVLVNGQAAGIWEYQRKGKLLEVKVTLWEPALDEISTKIQAQVSEVADFLGFSTLDCQIGNIPAP